MELVTNSTGATKFVLAILVVLSLISWGIIFSKWYELRKAARITYSFAREYAGAHTSARCSNGAERGGPPATIMERAMRFMKRRRRRFADVGARARFSGAQVEALQLVLDAETTTERDRLGRWFHRWRRSDQ